LLAEKTDYFQKFFILKRINNIFVKSMSISTGNLFKVNGTILIYVCHEKTPTEINVQGLFITDPHFL